MLYFITVARSTSFSSSPAHNVLGGSSLFFRISALSTAHLSRVLYKLNSNVLVVAAVATIAPEKPFRNPEQTLDGFGGTRIHPARFHPAVTRCVALVTCLLDWKNARMSVR